MVRMELCFPNCPIKAPKRKHVVLWTKIFMIECASRHVKFIASGLLSEEKGSQMQYPKRVYIGPKQWTRE
jgi:hypothetical protein